MRDLVIVGASGHGRVALDIARALGRRVRGFVDRGLAPGAEVEGAPVLAREPEECPLFARGEVAWFVAVGDNRAREGLFARLRELTGEGPDSLIHPSAIISGRAGLGAGLFVAPGAVVNTGAALGEGVILNTAATLDHDGVLGAFAQVSPGCHLAGNVTVGERAFLGTGASVIPGVTIGADAVVGAGAVVVRDVPPGVTAVGVPAKVRPRP